MKFRSKRLAAIGLLATLSTLSFAQNAQADYERNKKIADEVAQRQRNQDAKKRQEQLNDQNGTSQRTGPYLEARPGGAVGGLQLPTK